MKYLAITITLFLFGVFVACDDMYSVHQEFMDEGETVYLGIPVIQQVQGGKDRVQIVWKLNADPKIKACCIYWNDRSDSLEVVPDYTNEFMQQIVPVEEGTYIFELMAKGDNGLRSLISVSAGKSYGQNYQQRLYNVQLVDQSKTDDGLEMTWGTEEGCAFTELEYMNNAGDKKRVRFLGNETKLVLGDYTPAGDFTWQSYYLPEEFSIDTIPATPQKLKFLE